jgi:hypothetical protein
MALTVLTVPGCPNAAAFEERLAAPWPIIQTWWSVAARSPMIGRQRRRGWPARRRC